MWDIFSVFKIILPTFMDIFPWTHLTDCPRQNFNIGGVCLSLGSFVHYKMEKWDIQILSNNANSDLQNNLKCQLPDLPPSLKVSSYPRLQLYTPTLTYNLKKESQLLCEKPSDWSIQFVQPMKSQHPLHHYPHLISSHLS